MDLNSAPRALPLGRVRTDWPGLLPHRPHGLSDDIVAERFEALIIQSLLRSARAARLGDDGLGSGGETVRDLQDRQRAEAIARAAPLGVARLLAREAAR